jgi:hypothetical protein
MTVLGHVAAVLSVVGGALVVYAWVTGGFPSPGGTVQPWFYVGILLGCVGSLGMSLVSRGRE